MDTVTEKPKNKTHARRQWRRIIGLVMLGLFVTLFVAVLIQFFSPYFVHHDDIDALFVLSGDDCAPPCFLGITPGETTLNEARERLETVSWIADIETYDDSYFIWRTNGQQPNYLTEAGYVYSDSTRIIREMVVPTQIPFGGYLLTIGYPQMDADGFVMLYPERGLGIMPLPCPHSPHDYWFYSSQLVFYRLDHPVFDTVASFFPRISEVCWM